MMKSTSRSQTVHSVLAVLTPVIVIALARVTPAQWRQIQMRTMRKAEVICMNNAMAWADLAASCKDAYDSARLSV